MDAPESAASSCARAARELADLQASIEVNADWSAVERTAQSLANGLRIRNGPIDEHTVLGKTLLPQTLTTLLKVALVDSRVPDGACASAVFQVLRVGANLCMDHDDNRGYLLDAGFPQIVVSLLEGYAETLPVIPSHVPFLLSDPHLKIVKTAVGALLNLSLGYEPIQNRLISLEIPLTLLRLSIAIYPPGSWLSALETDSAPLDAENWLTRKGIADWCWRAISGLKDNQMQQVLFNADALPSLVIPLRAFINPTRNCSNSLYSDIEVRNSLFATDVEVLEEVCELIETVTMDIVDVRIALARGMVDNEEPACLRVMLDFIEFGDYVPGWENSGLGSEEVARWKRAVDLCKTAVIKAVVELSGEEANLTVLWDLANPQGGFVARMLKWLQDASTSTDVRDDLVICSTLSLGNLVRRESHSVAFVNPPTSAVPLLVKHLTPETDIKVKHGVIGLLKHIAQTPSNRPVLGRANVLEKLRTSEVFREKADIAEIVQMSAINLAKHLCTNNIENSITCILAADEGDRSSSCISQILALSMRSDSISVKSEGARVLVNAVKSLCSSTGNLQDPRRQAAIQSLTNLETANALAQLLGRSKKYPTLLNEAVVALCLISVQANGAIHVLDAVVSELPREISPSSRQNSINIDSLPGSDNASTPIAAPATALDMLVTILKNTEKKFPAELRANVCSLLAEIGRESLKKEGGGREREVELVRSSTRSELETPQTENLVLSVATRKTIEAWR